MWTDAKQPRSTYWGNPVHHDSEKIFVEIKIQSDRINVGNLA
jgi:hypothetical protein